jgi:FAD/FMN-containing dehydrogenase
MGRSTGQGALSLWMWNLKSADPILEYGSAGYSGPAIKLGSGMMAGEAYEAASVAGYRVVGGECGSVGIAAGYTQGGGHSMLSTAYGMGADQVLEWEVVTAQGEHLTATPEKNSDLYWALSGGGGGTYAVVLSMTAKMHPDGVVSGGTLAFANTNDTAYWEAISLWIQQAPALIGENNTIIYVVLDGGFQAYAITLPDQPASAVDALLAPFLSDLTRLNITYSLNTTEFDSYLDHFNNYYGPLPYGTQSLVTTIQSRMVPLAVTQSTNATAGLVEALQFIAADGSFLIGCAVMSVANASHPDNAVLPAWREAITGCNVISEWNFTAPLETNLAAKSRLVEVYAPALEAATPGGGVYLNEMDPWYQGDWKTTLFGENYDRLLDIKHTYDPSHTFWGNFTVGSDELFLDGSGRLCQA